MGLLICLTLCLVLISSDAKTSYRGHSVIRVTPKTEADVTVLNRLFSEDKGFDVWQHASGPDQPCDVRVSPGQRHVLQQYLDSLGLDMGVTIQDVEQSAQIQMMSSGQTAGSFNYSVYHQLEEVNMWMEEMVKTYPDIVKCVTVSSSYEGREIKALKIDTDSGDSSKQIIWIQSGIHAREWIGPATNMYMTNKLLQTYQSGSYPALETILDTFQWYILPVFNVDGYEYTWTNDRMWRKTRSDTQRETCLGVDPNRNWDYEWGGEAEGEDPNASSGRPCSNIYRGPKPFSEKSVKGVAEYLLTLKQTTSVAAFLDIHSYSQLWMTPWGYGFDIPEHFQVQNKSSKAAVDAIKRTSGLEYKYGPIASTIYPANGNSVDWAYGVLGSIFSVAVELRDTGKTGFLLPADQIQPCGEEMYAALVEFVKVICDYSK